MQTPPGTVYRFGPFAVDPAAGELLKHGKQVKIQDQPFRLLLILLENAGEVVTRAEIQGRIWEGNTFVDFDSSLRVAVGKLREALADDAASPHYVETIPKRGYRFLGSVAAAAHVADVASGTEPSPVASVPKGRRRRIAGASRWAWANWAEAGFLRQFRYYSAPPPSIPTSPWRITTWE
jgi:DNA-binding winged helix-turn-helix (wHTH) protein